MVHLWLLSEESGCRGDTTIPKVPQNRYYFSKIFKKVRWSPNTSEILNVSLQSCRQCDVPCPLMQSCSSGTPSHLPGDPESAWMVKWSFSPGMLTSTNSHDEGKSLLFCIRPRENTTDTSAPQTATFSLFSLIFLFLRYSVHQCTRRWTGCRMRMPAVPELRIHPPTHTHTRRAWGQGETAEDLRQLTTK